MESENAVELTLIEACRVNEKFNSWKECVNIRPPCSILTPDDIVIITTTTTTTTTTTNTNLVPWISCVDEVRRKAGTFTGGIQYKPPEPSKNIRRIKVSQSMMKGGIMNEAVKPLSIRDTPNASVHNPKGS